MIKEQEDMGAARDRAWEEAIKNDPFMCWGCGSDIRDDFYALVDSRGDEELDIVAYYDWIVENGKICCYCAYKADKARFE